MEIKAIKIIELLDLKNEYEEFKKVMDNAVEKFISAGYDGDFLIYRLKKEFEKKGKVILLIFLSAYEEERMV
jgi:hypothetical protein